MSDDKDNADQMKADSRPNRVRKDSKFASGWMEGDGSSTPVFTAPRAMDLRTHFRKLNDTLNKK